MTGQISGGKHGVTQWPEIVPDADRVTAYTEAPSPIIVPTVLGISRDSLAYWQSMTCFFNKQWFPERDRVTLPFCFFHIVKYSETHTVETSKKRVIVYEPQEALQSVNVARDPVRPGLMQTIADNIVLEPKEYRLEVIVPFTPLGRYVRQGADVMQSLFDTFIGALGGKDMSSSSIDWMRTKINEEFTERAISAIGEVSSIPGLAQNNFSALDSGNMVNKNSLDAMFERGNILQFKTWMGQDYKYVVIVNKVLEKRGTEDDVWRGELTLRELPVLSLSRVTGATQAINRSWVMGMTNKLGALAFGKENVGFEVPAFRAVLQEDEQKE